ncbi:MuF-C-terminal domain-containing protein [Pseudothauera rhizosphaerae]|uniref:Phage MuF C-terminal domain-containing protein n=1 Tax=Pseudothauera rhizosphaerae TaxID=2565932 RepID=A0A4V3W9M6_9RHOO|nr:hypothetical protein [Pseudothauera rhizosphaerae]THF55901.1 hypothetical protein E6O51_20155 [Pseudothauera rhizosphaerae]
MATNFFDQFDAEDAAPAAGNFFDQFDDGLAGTASPKQNTSLAGDLATDVKRGAQQLPGALTGLADIPVAAITGERYVSEAADALGEATGFQPGKWAEEARAEYSPQRQAGTAEIEQAWDEGSAADVAGAYLRNPGNVAGLVAESLPGMAAGGFIGRGALTVGRMAGAVARPAAGAAGAAQAARQAVIAGAGGEGAISAGQTMSHIDESVDPRRAAAAAAGTGALTAGLGYAGGRLAQRLGVVDPETAIAGGLAADRPPQGLVRRMLGGALSEGAFEELPQSVQEQMWQNWAEGRDLMEGVPRAAVEGAIAGGAMGAGANVLPARRSDAGQQEPAGLTIEPEFVDEPAGLLPAPVSTGTPNEQILQAEVERENEVAAADARAAELYRQRAEFEAGRGQAAPEEMVQSPATRRRDVEAALREQVEPQVILDENGRPKSTTSRYEIDLFHAEIDERMAKQQRNIEAGRRLQAARRPSEQMGINPADGPISAAAALAVDGGATQQLAQQVAAQEPNAAASGGADRMAANTPVDQAESRAIAGYSGGGQSTEVAPEPARSIERMSIPLGTMEAAQRVAARNRERSGGEWVAMPHPQREGRFVAALVAPESNQGAAQQAQPTRAMPLTETGAARAAERWSRERGEPYTVVPHPKVAGRFTAVPAAQIQGSQDGASPDDRTDAAVATPSGAQAGADLDRGTGAAPQQPDVPAVGRVESASAGPVAGGAAVESAGAADGGRAAVAPPEAGSPLGQALRILLDRTDGNGSPDGLTGPENAQARAEIVAALTGQRVAEIEAAPNYKFRTSVPQVERLLYDAAGIPAGNLAARRAPFLDWLDAQTGQQAPVQSIEYEEGETGGLRFSRAGRAAFTPDAYDAQQFAQAVDRIAAAETAPRTDLTVGDTPAVLRALGAKALPVQMPSSVIHKASRPAVREHDVPVEVLRNLPALLADPVMVFNSRTEQGALVALVEARDASSRPVVVAIHMDAKGGGFHRINRIASIYGKDRVADIENWMRGDLRYYQTQKAPQWLRAVGLQLPEANTIKRLNPSVITEADVVNAAPGLRRSVGPAPTQASPITRATLREAMAARFPSLAGAVDAMLKRGDEGKRGGLVMIDSTNPLRIAQAYSRATGRSAMESVQYFSEGETVQGFYDPKSGLTFMVGPNLTAETVPAVLLHETTHGQQRERIDAKAMDLIGRRDKLARPLRDFLSRVAGRMMDAGEANNQSEAAAYIVEQAVLEGRQAGFSAADGKLLNWIDMRLGKPVGDIVRVWVAMIRAWGMRHGFYPRDLTVDDLVAFARAGVRQAARGDVLTKEDDDGRQASRPDLAAVTASENFKMWFADSKMKTTEGKPIVFMHGSPNEFEAFDNGRLGLSSNHATAGMGHFFTRDKGVAEKYADGGHLYRGWLRMENPYVMKLSETQAIEDPQSAAKRREALKRQGRDGIIMLDDAGKPWAFVVFEPWQFKSTDNRGTFDEFDDRFRFSRAGRTASAISNQAQLLYERATGQQRSNQNDPFRAENTRLREQDRTLWNKAKQQLRRWLSPGGLLPDAVFAEKIKRDSEFQAVEFDVRHAVGGLERAVKQDYGVPFDKLTDAQQRALSEALAGKVPAGLPEATRAAVVAMRQYIDSLSGEYLQIIQSRIDALMLQAQSSGRANDAAAAINEIELYEKIRGNIGAYVHRSYQAFDDPTWFRKVPTSTLNAARRYLRDGYMEDGKTSEAEALRLADVALNEILKNGTAYDSMESFIAEGKLGAKDLSVLTRRKNVPPEIRALLGEYTDSRLNFTKSATKMGRLIWNQRFLDRVREIGVGTFLFEGRDRPPAATTQIAAEGSEVYAPLNGLWTFPEVAQAFKDALAKEKMSDLYRFIVRANGLVKYGKTVLSPTTAMRNWQSAMFFALANGHFDLSQMRKSVAAFREQVRQNASGDDLAYLRHLKKLGVVYDTPYAGEMMRYIEDAKADTGVDAVMRLFGASEGAIAKGLRGMRQVNQIAQGFYSFGDDFWKVIGFENEKANLMKAGMSLAEAEREAAQRIRNTYPTYSMVGAGVRWLSRFPLMGTFVSFPAEIVRTTANMLRITAADLKSDNPAIRAMGMKRAVGMAMVSGMFYGLAALTKAMAGVDDDEEEALRDLAPEWQKNSTFLFAGRDEKGNLRYFDLSFLDPYGYWKRPITAMLRDQPWEDAAASAVKDMLTPFFGADIATSAIFQVLANKKETGGKVYQENAAAFDQAGDIANHLRKALQPGFVGNVERLTLAAQGVRREGSGQPYDMEDEMVALLGWRASTMDPKTALYYRSFEFNDAMTEARQVLTRTLRSVNAVSPEDIREARTTAQRRQEDAFTEMHRLVQAARAAGMNPFQIRQVLQQSGISRANAAALMRGTPPPLVIGAQAAGRAVQQARVMEGPEFAQEVAKRFRAAATAQ